MTVIWLYIEIDIRWVGDVIMTNRRFDEERKKLMKIPCSSPLDAEQQLKRMRDQVTIPSGTVSIRRICAADYGDLLLSKAMDCAELNQQFALPAYLGDCLDARGVK